MILPDQIIKSSRKTLSLSIGQDGKIVVHAPNKMKDELINNFIRQKQDWLATKLSIIRNNQNKYDDVLHLKKFLLYGKQISIYMADVKKIEVSNDYILVPKKIEAAKVQQSIVNFYRKTAKEILTKRLGYLQSVLKIRCSNFKIANSKGRWGSCNSAGVITINWRVIMMPPECIDYVIIHELCHLIEMNHSKRFWTLVETFLPNYNALRQSLKEYGFLLEMYR